MDFSLIFVSAIWMGYVEYISQYIDLTFTYSAYTILVLFHLCFSLFLCSLTYYLTQNTRDATIIAHFKYKQVTLVIIVSQ